MTPTNLPGESMPLLRPADIVEPLTLSDTSDANAILYAATGREGTFDELAAFSYYHKKRQAELVENPAVGVDHMLEELFDSLPKKIEEDNLVDRLVAEVQMLQVSAHQTKPAVAAQTRVVSLQPLPPTPAPEGQLALFNAHFVDKQPSAELVKAAENLQNYHENFFKYFGFIATLMYQVYPESKALKIALMAPAVAEVILELPLMVAVSKTRGRLLRARFREALSAEYPHIRRELLELKRGRHDPRIFDLSAKLDAYAETVVNEHGTTSALTAARQ